MITPTDDDRGRRVIYHDRYLGRDNTEIVTEEHGTISSWNDFVVFVVFDGDNHSKAVTRELLTWEKEKTHG